MFYDIVGKNYVEFPVKFIAAFTCIVANESAGHSVLGKKGLSLFCALLHNVNSRYLATFFGKRLKVSAFAASYLENLHSRTELDMLFEVWYIIVLACGSQFIEIAAAVKMSVLHRILICCISYLQI